MTVEERNKLKETIERKIKTTEEAVSEYREMTHPIAPDVSIGRISRMDAINNKSVMEAALRQAEAKLIRLRTAFENIDSQNFGI